MTFLHNCQYAKYICKFKKSFCWLPSTICNFMHVLRYVLHHSVYHFWLCMDYGLHYTYIPLISIFISQSCELWNKSCHICFILCCRHYFSPALLATHYLPLFLQICCIRRAVVHCDIVSDCYFHGVVQSRLGCAITCTCKVCGVVIQCSMKAAVIGQYHCWSSRAIKEECWISDDETR